MERAVDRKGEKGKKEREEGICASEGKKKRKQKKRKWET
jgi:hypothetical protein